LAPENPEILTWLAFLSRKAEAEKSQAYLDRAVAASPYLVSRSGKNQFRLLTGPPSRNRIAGNSDIISV